MVSGGRATPESAVGTVSRWVARRAARGASSWAKTLPTPTRRYICEHETDSGLLNAGGSETAGTIWNESAREANLCRPTAVGWRTPRNMWDREIGTRLLRNDVGHSPYHWSSPLFCHGRLRRVRPQRAPPREAREAHVSPHAMRHPHSHPRLSRRT